MNYAAIDKTTKVVINNIEWDGKSYLDPYWLKEHDLIPWDEKIKGYPISPGYTYDEINQGFISLKPEENPSFVFNTSIWTWEAPIPYPTDGGKYIWDEMTKNWILPEKNTKTIENLSKDNKNLNTMIDG